MTANCASCGTKLEPGDVFCQNCGASATATSSPTPTPRASSTSLTLGRFERAVYFRIARVFSWVLMVVALGGFFYALVSALQSAGDVLRIERSVSAGEVKASIASDKAGRGNQSSNREETTTDPRLVGEYETALAELVNLFPADVRQQEGGDDAARNQLRSVFSQFGNDIKERISVAKETKGVLQSFSGMDVRPALYRFIDLKKQRSRDAAVRQAEATTKFLYLGGTIFSTAILITLVSMILVLLAIERNTRAVK